MFQIMQNGKTTSPAEIWSNSGRNYKTVSTLKGKTLSFVEQQAFVAKQRKLEEAKCGVNYRDGNLPDFEPDKWDDKDHRAYNNCYAYAFLDIALNADRPDGKPQPGYKKGLEPLDESQFTCKNFQERMQVDHDNKLIFRPGSDKSECPCGYRKISMVLALGERKDYHYYRQDSSMWWSHKPGSTSVQNWDASGKYIHDPEVADRNYDKDHNGINYSTSCGYICVPTTDSTEELKAETSMPDHLYKLRNTSFRHCFRMCVVCDIPMSNMLHYIVLSCNLKPSHISHHQRRCTK
jgi:hypothetical protein